MPFIEVLVFGKRMGDEEKRAMFQGLSAAVQDVLGSAEGQIRIALQDGFPESSFLAPRPAVQQNHISNTDSAAEGREDAGE
ncbi:MAG: hypothetical protein H0Z37_00985 [Firmicutes bacterium]|nr:hypothetical protein [Bacillota bacterium]